jgi:hypothetical protein
VEQGKSQKTYRQRKIGDRTRQADTITDSNQGREFSFPYLQCLDESERHGHRIRHLLMSTIPAQAECFEAGSDLSPIIL